MEDLLYFISEGLAKKKPAGMKTGKLRSFSYMTLKGHGRILSASRAVLKTHLDKYTIKNPGKPFHFFYKFINKNQS